MSTVEQRLCNAAEEGRVEEALQLLRDNPGLNVNWADDVHQMTALRIAAFRNLADIVKALLAHPHINVNQKDKYEDTPFLIGCQDGSMSVVRVLLKDPRVNVTLENGFGCTPLWLAAQRRRNEVVEWLIASGRDLGDIANQTGKRSLRGEKCTTLEIAKQAGNPKIVSVLERFVINPTQTCYELRVKLGFSDALAIEVFVLIVFLCDGFLQLKPSKNTSNHAATRFFTIAQRLPIELQMILCHRAMNSAKDSVLSQDSEVGFKNLARILLSLSE